MSADKTIGDEEKTGRRRRLALARSRPEAIEEDEPEQDDAEAESQDRGVTAGKGRATPSRRRQEEEEDSGNLATRTVGGLRGYFEGVRSELEKVVWPTREEARRLTIIVLFTLLVASLVLGTISFVFTELFRVGLGSPIILLGVMFLAVGGGLIFYRYNSRRSSY